MKHLKHAALAGAATAVLTAADADAALALRTCELMCVPAEPT